MGGEGANEKNTQHVPGVGLVLAANLSAQGVYATLTGVVTDPSQAVVINAKVTLKDAQSGSQRDTVTNNDGYFTFASVPVGTYVIAVEAPGFNTYSMTGIALNGGEKRNVDVTMKVGATTDKIEITGSADLIVPVDSRSEERRVGKEGRSSWS